MLPERGASRMELERQSRRRLYAGKLINCRQNCVFLLRRIGRAVNAAVRFCVNALTGERGLFRENYS
jgi:hypothetical protein